MIPRFSFGGAGDELIRNAEEVKLTLARSADRKWAVVYEVSGNIGTIPGCQETGPPVCEKDAMEFVQNIVDLLTREGGQL